MLPLHSPPNNLYYTQRYTRRRKNRSLSLPRFIYTDNMSLPNSSKFEAQRGRKGRPFPKIKRMMSRGRPLFLPITPDLGSVTVN